jgi:hypothetical protein
MCFCAAQNEILTISPRLLATIERAASWLAKQRARTQRRAWHPSAKAAVPKMACPREHTILHHLLIAAQHVVDENNR